MLDATANPTSKAKRPGPKARHSGMFRKGDDARRPAGQRLYDGITLAQMARQHGPQCIELLSRVLTDEHAPLRDRIRASELLMDRGHGKAVSVIDMQVTHSRDIATLSREELRAIAAGQPPRTPITIQGEASDLAPTASHTADPSHRVVT